MAAKLGPIAAVAVAVAGALIGVAVAAKKFADAMEREARELSEYNADLAAAVAETDIRREMSKFDRAQKLGPDLAEFERSRARMAERFYDLVTEIKLLMIKTAGPVMGFLEAQVNHLAGIIHAMTTIIDTAAMMLDLVRLRFDDARQHLVDIGKKMREAIDIYLGRDASTDMVDEFTRQFLGLVPVPPGGGRPPINLPPGWIP